MVIAAVTLIVIARFKLPEPFIIAPAALAGVLLYH
jgi:hypothetical protein